jgi:hypothetical protein
MVRKRCVLSGNTLSKWTQLVSRFMWPDWLNWHHQANKLAPKQVVRWAVGGLFRVYMFIITVTVKNKKSIKQIQQPQANKLVPKPHGY